MSLILAVQNDLPEVAEQFLNEKILLEKEMDEFCIHVRSLIDGGATSVYTEEADSRLFVRALNRHRQNMLPKSLRVRFLNLYHQPVMAGHPGGRRMYMSMCQTFTGPVSRQRSTNTYSNAQSVCGSALSSVGIRRRYNCFRLMCLWRRLQWIFLAHFPIQGKVTHLLVIPG